MHYDKQYFNIVHNVRGACCIIKAVTQQPEIRQSDISGVDRGLLSEAVTNLKILNDNYNKLTKQEIVKIITAFIKVTTLHDLSCIDLGY